MDLFRPTSRTGSARCDRWLRRRRRRYAAAGVLVAGVLAALLWLGHRYTPAARASGSVVAIESPAALRVRVTQTETVRVIRLYGCDLADAPNGVVAWLTRELAGRRVTLVYPEPEAASAAALVYREDGLFINEHLVDRGLGRADPGAARPWAKWFGRVERWARADGRGRWSAPRDGHRR